ncbi:hypothetical protein F5877DRAFT_73418 [Lentinula edodes]|nr:hypothetical protein F5877DRAFT_73418 [Lentinula edodes]
MKLTLALTVKVVLTTVTSLSTPPTMPTRQETVRLARSKRNKIFWHGATTGGGNSPPGFATLYQRHRAVRMTGWDVEGDVEVWVPCTSPFSNISTSTSAKSSASQIQLADVPLTAHKISAATLNKALHATSGLFCGSSHSSYPEPLEDCWAHRRCYNPLKW